MRRLSLVVAATTLGAMACLSGGQYPSEGEEESCPVGSEGCPCTGGGACDPGLSCRSERCVDLDGAGGSGAASCAVVCDKLLGCFGEAVDGADCTPGCEETRRAEPERMGACLACMDRSSCSEILPADGSRPACDAACGGGGGPYCETDRDCDSQAGEVCDVSEGVCEVACAADADCEHGQLCCPYGDVPGCSDECGVDGGTGGSGGPLCPEGEGLSSSDGLCHPNCGDVADCYDFSAYCASDSLCYATEDLAQCARAGNFPGMEAGAPLLFDPGQDTIGVGGDLCVKSPANCTSNGNVCQFSFRYYDPDGDVAETHSALYSRIRVIDSSGGTVYPYDVLEASGNTLSVLGCFDEADTSVMLALVLLDDADHQSNPLCFSGSAP